MFKSPIKSKASAVVVSLLAVTFAVFAFVQTPVKAAETGVIGSAICRLDDWGSCQVYLESDSNGSVLTVMPGYAYGVLKARDVSKGSSGTSSSGFLDSQAPSSYFFGTGSVVGNCVTDYSSRVTKVVTGDVRNGANGYVFAPSDCTGLFTNLTNVETMDLRAMDFSNMAHADYMFANNHKLKAIYVNNLFKITHSITTEGMFNGVGSDTNQNGCFIYNDYDTYFVGSDGHFYIHQWLQVDGDWYYFGNDYKMLKDAWVKWNGYWYYLGSDGSMETDCFVDYKGDTYYLRSNGRMAASSWVKIDGSWYYFNASGRMLKNSWLQYKGSWYYLGSDGVMYSNAILSVGGVSYHFNASGACDYKVNQEILVAS